MSTHEASIVWKRTSREFTYDTYNRDHAVRFGTGTELKASSAVEYRGNPALVNPEEMLVAALSNCHMLTFLAVAAKQKLVVDAYDDDAVGHLEKNASGRIAITRVTLRPRVVFAPGTSVDHATLTHLHEQAHRGCFIANSVTTEVTVEPREG